MYVHIEIEPSRIQDHETYTNIFIFASYEDVYSKHEATPTKCLITFSYQQNNQFVTY